MIKIVCCGEAMMELSRSNENWRMALGGDTLNTAVHLTRCGYAVSYMTALGLDPFSTNLRDLIASEFVRTDLIVTHPTRNAGLYAISTDQCGERSFTYWRETSAARLMFECLDIEVAQAEAVTADLFYFSLISLAILPDEGRRQLLNLAAIVRENGGLVAFDGNYRPRLWTSAEEALKWRNQAIVISDIGLPTLDDEALLCGTTTAVDVSTQWRQAGCPEVVVKLGADGCFLPDGSIGPVPKVLTPIDTSGAGDAFNGGYLAARIGGRNVADAVRAGHALAGWNVMRRGAIPPRDAAAPYPS